MSRGHRLHVQAARRVQPSTYYRAHGRDASPTPVASAWAARRSRLRRHGDPCRFAALMGSRPLASRIETKASAAATPQYLSPSRSMRPGTASLARSLPSAATALYRVRFSMSRIPSSRPGTASSVVMPPLRSGVAHVTRAARRCAVRRGAARRRRAQRADRVPRRSAPASLGSPPHRALRHRR